MQRSVEEVAASIACEDSAGPVPAVGGGGQADHQQARGRIAEARDRPPPVIDVTVAPDLLSGHPLSMMREARATSADDDPPAKRV
jgi:hypothetical protein